MSTILLHVKKRSTHIFIVWYNFNVAKEPESKYRHFFDTLKFSISDDLQGSNKGLFQYNPSPI